MMFYIRNFLRDQRGHTAIEYGMIIGVGAIAIVISLQVMGGVTATTFENVLAAWGPPGG